MFKRKSGGENGEPPRKRGRPRKNANVEEGTGDGTAAAPIEIQVSGGGCSFLLVLRSGLKFGSCSCHKSLAMT